MTVRTIQTDVIDCDGKIRAMEPPFTVIKPCETTFTPTTGIGEMVAESLAEKAGWKRDGRKHLCPRCKKRSEELPADVSIFG